ncbi:F-box protein At3g26010-like [Papaver somniferum]|uniref:F-box protein At3g26010-like n=1 Tax=Papaver somniferum TaxID=3469 RepID=UPI000E6FE11A|nr:F-box protein At3g26010-like [Papaver somniferum]XP_026424308.1 F-box protein At3g26010-like [Papaver somniferum]
MAASSSASRTRSSLSDNILIEIFTYLPLNSIYKFKCLSKVWLSNFSSPNFIYKWFQINNKSLPWIHYHTIAYSGSKRKLGFRNAYIDLHSEFMHRNEHLFSFQFLMNEKPFLGCKLDLLGSSNGLVLFQSVPRSGYQKRGYYVCNPLTQKWVSLPSPPRSKAKGGLATSGIFCDNSSFNSSCYKVVHIPEFDTPSKNFNVDLFCSDLGVWKSFQVSCDENVQWRQSMYREVVILNGVLFRIEKLKRMFVYNLNQNNGSGGHQCSVINMPDEESGLLNFSGCIGESEGGVCYTKTTWKGMEMVMSIWVLDKVNWQILHKDISVNNIFAEFRRVGDAAPVHVLGFSPVDRNVVFFGCKDWLWGFNIQTRSLEELCMGNGHLSNPCLMVQPFVLKPMPTVLPPPSCD